MTDLRKQAESARAAWRALALVEESAVNRALERMAVRLRAQSGAILAENEADLIAARKKGLAESFIERMTLNDKRIGQAIEGIGEVIEFPSPVNEVIESSTRPSGLHIVKRRVPLGVVGIIYESRPNVTVDAAALCVKSGNAVILRGGSDAINSNRALIVAIRAGLADAGLPADCVSLVMDTSRETALEMMTMNGVIDVLIPRGGKGLIESVVRTATVPVIQTGDGICHVYLDSRCDFEMARSIAVSAKISRPAVCNSAETLLVERAIAADFLPKCLDELHERRVEIRGCAETLAMRPYVVAATEESYHTEYNDYIYNVKVVRDIDEAIEHINEHGSHHSEAIVTGDAERGRYFQSRVDAAAVYVNASTRFTDGNIFGLGAEIGISNQKLHARGPMGLKELTTYKYEVTGNGEIR